MEYKVSSFIVFYKVLSIIHFYINIFHPLSTIIHYFPSFPFFLPTFFHHRRINLRTRKYERNGGWRLSTWEIQRYVLHFRKLFLPFIYSSLYFSSTLCVFVSTFVVFVDPYRIREQWNEISHSHFFRCLFDRIVAEMLKRLERPIKNNELQEEEEEEEAS